MAMTPYGDDDMTNSLQSEVAALALSRGKLKLHMAVRGGKFTYLQLLALKAKL